MSSKFIQVIASHIIFFFFMAEKYPIGYIYHTQVASILQNWI